MAKARRWTEVEQAETVVVLGILGRFSSLWHYWV